MALEIRFDQVDYTYQPNTPFEQKALFKLNLTIKDGSYTAIVGHTGSGKSTLVQQLNALIKPTKGRVSIGDRIITSETNNKNLKPIRKKVGIVFQFPEAQLFEETVEKDIAFGPQNFGVSENEAKKLAAEKLTLVGLDLDYLQRSPFELSGGQMRRVAIAGVLAMEPEVLVLDEPTAGLDPQGRKEMMEMFQQLHKEQGMTIVLEKGKITKSGTPQDVFSDTLWLKKKQLGVPTATAFAEKLVQKGLNFSELPLTADDLADMLVESYRKQVDQNDG